MELQVFGLFAKMINGLPARAILKALDLECKTLEDDFEHHRSALAEDAFSILSFRQFVRMAQLGTAMHCIKPLPPDHIEFYKNTIVRLIQADELPASAMKDFDFTFTSGS
jgi:hypothetical protein